MVKKKEFEIPIWVDAKSWRGYLEMRKAIRKPMTARAMEMAIGKLGDLMQEGEDPNKVLDQSVFNSWQGLFPVKSTGRQQFNGRTGATDAVSKTLKNLGFTN